MTERTKRFLGTNNPYHLPRPRAACAVNPNDPCCRSCGQAPGCLEYDDAENCISFCDESADDCSGTLSELEDALPLRCFDQKRRFGIDFLQPIDRYTTGLTAPTVPDRNGQLVPNPLFSDLNPNDQDAAVRSPNMVFIAGIVGVPWQDIARTPDLAAGFQNAGELTARGTWDVILGDPANYVLPLDPLMIESVDPRSGSNPITQDPLAPPGDPNENAINGSEYTIPMRDDLQYACVFALPEPRDCTGALSCDCPTSASEPTDNPLCDPSQTTLQVRAKAYPALRELALLKSVGDQGIVTSICPAQVTDPTRADFGYRPAVASVLDGVKVGLAQCFYRELTLEKNGQVDCRIVEALRVDTGCDDICGAPGRQPTASDDPLVAEIRKDSLFAATQWNCFCEIRQTAGDELFACVNDPSSAPAVNGSPVHGWCYVDEQTGNPALLAGCPASERRILRFVGNGQPAPAATAFLGCME